MSVRRCVHQSEESAGGNVYRRTFRVVLSSAGGGALEACYAQPFRKKSPFRSVDGTIDGQSFAAWPPDARLVDGAIWDVTVNFAPKNQQDDEDVLEPWNRPPEVETDSQMVDRYPIKDINGKPIVNSAKHPYDGVAVPACIDVWMITRNLRNSYPGAGSMYKNHVNGRSWNGADKGHALCKNIQYATREEKNKDAPKGKWRFVQQRLTFWIDWDDAFSPIELIDQGPFYLDKNGNPTVPTDSSITKYNGQVLLDGNGKLLSAAARAAGNVKYIKVDVYRTADFNSLALNF